MKTSTILRTPELDLFLLIMVFLLGLLIGFGLCVFLIVWEGSPSSDGPRLWPGVVQGRNEQASFRSALGWGVPPFVIDARVHGRVKLTSTPVQED